MAAGADLRLDHIATSSFLTLPLTMVWAYDLYNQLLHISLRIYHIEVHCMRSTIPLYVFIPGIG